MNDHSLNDKLESRIQSLVDDRLFRAFWDGVVHFKTQDLVLLFDENQEVDPVTIFPREKLVAGDSVPS